MIGIVLASHSEMAEGMIKSCKMLMGETIEKITSVSLLPGMSMEEFDEKLSNSIQEMNDGSGVLVLCDLFGGTPSNRSAMKISKDVQIISGVNLSIVLELLCRRNETENIQELDINGIIETAKGGLINVNEYYLNLLNKK